MIHREALISGYKKGQKKRLQALGDDLPILLHLNPFCQAFIAKIRFELFKILWVQVPVE